MPSKIRVKGLIASVVVTALVKKSLLSLGKQIWFLKPQNKTQVAGTIRVPSSPSAKQLWAFSAVPQVTLGSEAMRGGEETWVFGQNGSCLFSFLPLLWLNGSNVSKWTPPSLSVISDEGIERDRGEADRCSRKHQIAEGLLISVLAFLVNNEHMNTVEKS